MVANQAALNFVLGWWCLSTFLHQLCEKTQKVLKQGISLPFFLVQSNTHQFIPANKENTKQTRHSPVVLHYSNIFKNRLVRPCLQLASMSYSASTRIFTFCFSFGLMWSMWSISLSHGAHRFQACFCFSVGKQHTQAKPGLVLLSQAETSSFYFFFIFVSRLLSEWGEQKKTRGCAKLRAGLDWEIHFVNKRNLLVQTCRRDNLLVKNHAGKPAKVSMKLKTVYQTCRHQREKPNPRGWAQVLQS